MTTSRSERRDLGRAVYSMLDGLGRDPNEVAASLRGYGILGQRGSSTDCAVARYLNAVVGSDPSIQSIVVRVQTVRIRSGRRWAVGTRVKVPAPVSRFICAFDQGRYPDLLGEPARRTRLSERTSELA